jgi:hypothetical protein
MGRDDGSYMCLQSTSSFTTGLPAPRLAAAVVQMQGVTVQKKSTAILQIVTLTSPDWRYDSLASDLSMAWPSAIFEEADRYLYGGDVGPLPQRGEVSHEISYENRIASFHPAYLTHG